MVEVTERVNPDESPPKPDARSERWREHRQAVRQSFVDAALTAIDSHGPDVSMGDIASTAGAAKPKLYRHFADKSDLYAAIVEHVREMLWNRILLATNLFEDSVSTLIERGTSEYAIIVSEQPNLFRFLVHSHFAGRAGNRRTNESSAGPDPALDSARAAARKLAEVFADATGADQENSSAIELVSYSAFGAVASATDWWLGDSDARAPVMTIETFTSYVAALMLGIVESTCVIAGVTIDADRPLHTAFSTEGDEVL